MAFAAAAILAAATPAAASAGAALAVGPELCAANGLVACPLREVRNATSGCNCYESPDVVPPKKAKFMLALNFVSVLFSALMVYAWTHIPSKRSYPNNLILHVFVFCLLCHVATGLGVLGGSFGEAAGAFDLDNKARILSNTSGAVCTFQSMMIYYGYLGTALVCGCLSYTLYFATVKMKQMAALTPLYKKQVVVSYALPLLVAVFTGAVPTNAPYSMYCSVVYPLKARVGFYIPFILVAVVGAPYVLPTSWTVIHMWKATSTSLFATRLSFNMKRGGTAKFRVKRRDSAAALKKKGLPTQTLLRLTGFAFVFLFSVSGASLKRVVHSFKYETYYETPDAGLVGITEYIACTIGMLLSFVFGMQRDVLAFFHLAKPKVKPSISAMSTAKPSAKVTQAGTRKY